MRRFLVGMVMAGIAVITPVGAFAGDREIAEHILKKVDVEKKAGNLRGFDIKMKVDDGKVMLSGKVANKQQMETLLKIASHTSHLGTKRVLNRITISKEEQTAAKPEKEKSRFPNLLAVFRSEKRTPAETQATAHEDVKPLSAELDSEKQSSRRTFQLANAAAMQAKSQIEPKKQATSNHLASKASELPIQVGRPTEAFRAVKMTPAKREVPTAARRIRRQVELASNELEDGAPQSSAAPAIRIAPAPQSSTAVNRPTQLTPIPRQDSGHAAPPLSEAQLQQLRIAQLQQLQWQQMQQMQQARLASNQMPVAFAPAGPGSNGMSAMPMAAPNYMPASSGPAIHHDHPNMPPYAWPGYAAHPNYAALTYPKQYSPSAWPYIGPFYPYPQVPLGWRKVQLEWDDGWWFLNFKNRHFR